MDERGLSQHTLSSLLDTTQSTIRGWLLGATPRQRMLESLARVLNVNVQWLEVGRGPQTPREALGDTVNEAITKAGLTQGGAAYSARNVMRQARVALGWSFADLSKHTKSKYKPAALRAVEEGQTRASERMIEEVCQALGVEKEALMTGSDEPVHRGAMRGTFGAKPDLDVEPGMRAKYVPLLSMAQAGTADTAFTDSGYDHEGVVAFDPKDPKAYAVTIVGDSMEDEYREGDIAVVYPSHRPQQGNLVICRLNDKMGGDVMFKIFSSLDSGKRVKLTSYNPAYPALDFRREDFVFIHPVSQVTKRLMR